MKKVLAKLEEKKAPEETIKEFKENAQTALKRILANYKDYDVLVGESFGADAMYVQPSSLSETCSLSTH